MKGYLKACVLLCLLAALFIVVKRFCGCDARHASRRMQTYNTLKQCYLTDGVFADDIVDSDGEPILSWRVVCANSIKDAGEWNPTRPIDVSKPWHDDDNMKASKCKPYCFRFLSNLNSDGYDDEGREETTCLARIKEIHEQLKTGAATREELAGKAYLVLLAPEYAFRWTKPYDVSWKDLASGKVKLREDSAYLTVDGCSPYLEEPPKTLEEWRDFCGVDDLAAED